MARITLILIMISATCMIQASDHGQQIKVVAKRFEFSPSEITISKGVPVTLVLTSEDATHGLAIKEFNVKTEAKKGQTAEITFTPTQIGDFTAKCSHFCGRHHGDMALLVHVR